MTHDDPSTKHALHLPRRQTLQATAFAAATAIAVLGLFILPAEYGVDPTGFGGLVGINAIAAPAHDAIGSHTAADGPFRDDVVHFPVQPGEGLEYKFRLVAGAGMVYGWNATGPVVFDFHGEPEGDTTGAFESYHAGTGAGADGSFTAPFTGSHGWYFRNDGVEAVIVTLTTAGHYEVLGRR